MNVLPLAPKRPSRFSREHYAQYLGVRRGNVTSVDAVVVGIRTYVVVRCECGTQWRTPFHTFRRCTYAGRCGESCTMPKRPMREATQQRAQHVINMLASGMAAAEVAHRAGLSVDRVRKIARKAAA